MKKTTFRVLDPENDIWWEDSDLYIRDSDGRGWQFRNAYLKRVGVDEVDVEEISIREMGLSVSKEDYEELEKKLEVKGLSRFSISAKHDGVLPHAETGFQSISFRESDGSDASVEFKSWLNDSVGVPQGDEEM